MTSFSGAIQYIIGAVSGVTFSGQLTIHPFDMISILIVLVSINLLLDKTIVLSPRQFLIYVSIVLIYTSIVILHVYAELFGGWTEMIYRLYSLSIPILPALLSISFIYMSGVFRRRKYILYYSGYLGTLITLLVFLSLTTPVKQHLLSNPYVGYLAMPEYLALIHIAIFISSILVPVTNASRLNNSRGSKGGFIIAIISVSISLFLGLYTFYSAVALFHLMILASALGLMISIKLGVDHELSNWRDSGL